jgi:L-ectoine synthase
MIVRTLDEILDTDRDVRGPTFASHRLLLKKDGMGFSMHDTVMPAGTETTLWYANHLEAVYCIEGTGKIEDLVNGQTHQLAPGSLYALDGHEKHIVRTHTDMRIICVFNPPVTGGEVHGPDGSYPLVDD